MKVTNLDEVGPAPKAAADCQMKKGNTTVIEIMCTKELSEAFCR